MNRVIAYAAMGGTISANIFFPAIASLRTDLDASNELIAASVSLFILFQGITPILWSGVSEIKGRRTSYLASFGRRPPDNFDPHMRQGID